MGHWLYSLAYKGYQSVCIIIFGESPIITVFSWLWQSNRYVALKITNCFENDRKSASDELEMSNHIAKIDSSHRGRKYIRLVDESFSIPGPFGEHIALVFAPLREPLWLLGRHLDSTGVLPSILQAFLKLFLEGLDYLHSECHVIHTGKYIMCLAQTSGPMMLITKT